MKIADWREKINRPDIFFSGLIILVAFASFGLGRLSKLHEARGLLQITPPPSSAALGHLPFNQGGGTEGVSASGGLLIASKSGSKYHFPWCAGAGQIAEKNKITFASVEEARKAGYTPASNCKGLE